MEILEAIRHRRSVRSYREQAVAEETVRELLEAAVQAPSAMNAQPWAFAVVQDRQRLTSLSDRAKAHLLEAHGDDPRMDRYREELSDPDFDIFYGAGTLIVICAAPQGFFPAEDCCLAGQNLMLAAFGKGLGTCCIGWARPLLSLPETKTELSIPEDFTPVLPIILGYPGASPPAPPRNPPRVFAWR
jgi:nitroreductase